VSVIRELIIASVSEHVGMSVDPQLSAKTSARSHENSKVQKPERRAPRRDAGGSAAALRPAAEEYGIGPVFAQATG
jgi:hypothetical protein